MASTLPVIRKSRPPVPQTPEVAELVLQHFADGGTWRSLNKRNDLPDAMTVRKWFRESADLSAALQLAKALKGDWNADEGWRILADLDLDKIDSKRLSAYVALAKHKADYRKWLASCAAPETYGDRVKLEVTVEGSIRGVLAAPLARAPVVLGARVLGDDEDPEDTEP